MLKKALFFGSILLFSISLIGLCRVLLLGYYPDFQTQYFVPQMVFSGTNPYEGGEGLYTPQVYPPTALFFFLPFSLISYDLAPTLYVLLSIAALFVSLLLLFKMYKIPYFSTKALILFSLAFIAFPTKFTLGMGQVNVFILLFLVVALYLQKKKSIFLSGIFLGVSFLIKLFPTIYFGLCILLLIKSNTYKKITLGITVAVAVGCIFSFVFVPKDSINGFLNVLPSFFSSWKLDYYNQSIGGFVGRSFGQGLEATITKIIFSTLLICVTFYMTLNKRRYERVDLVFSTLLTLNLIINTFSWQHHFVWMIIPFIVTFHYLLKNNMKMVTGGLVLSYLLIAANFRDPGVLPIVLQSHVFLGAVILLFIQWYIFLKSRVVH